MEKTAASNNRVSIGGHIVKGGVSNFLEDSRFVHSVIIFNIFNFVHGIGPETFKSAITQEWFW